MSPRSGLLGALVLGAAWTAGLLVLYRVPFDPVAAAWRLGFFFALAWILGLVVLWLWSGMRWGRWSGKPVQAKEPDSVDPTTGLPTRASFHRIVQDYLDASVYQSEKSLVGIVRVKNLEEITLSHGAEEAERVIVRISRALFDSLRGADLLGRHDREELIAFLPKASSLSWETISRRIQGNVAAQSQRAQNPTGVEVVTGHSEFDPGSPASLEVLLEKAYEEMEGNPGKEEI